MAERNMTFVLDRNQRRLFHAALGTDHASGIPINGVHIRKGMAEATDGFLLLQVPIDYDGDDEVVIPKVPAAVKGDVAVAVSGDIVRMEGRNGVVATETATRGTFPDMSKLRPHGCRRKPRARTALSPDVLRTLLRSLPADTTHIRFHVYRESDGVSITASRPNAPDIHGVLMPMFVKWMEVEDGNSNHD